MEKQRKFCILLTGNLEDYLSTGGLKFIGDG